MQNYTGKTVFLGIDAHKVTYSVTAICEGYVIKKDTFPASPKALVAYCKKAFRGAEIKSAYEAGFCGFGLHRILVEQGIANIVVHPASIEVESQNLKKTDKRDSKKIAEQLAANRLKCVFIPSIAMENKRCVSRMRETFVKQRTRVATQVKSLLNFKGMIPFNESPRISRKWLKELLSLELDENLRFCLTKLAWLWIYLSGEISQIEKKMGSLDTQEKILYDLYLKIPGFGPKISQTLVYELEDTMQFSNEEKLFSFCGLTPSEHSSGQHKRLGNITRQGRPILRKMLIQAAWRATAKDPYFSEYFERLKARRGASRAIVAVARKLIGRARCAIKKKESFLAVSVANKATLQD